MRSLVRSAIFGLFFLAAIAMAQVASPPRPGSAPNGVENVLPRDQVAQTRLQAPGADVVELSELIRELAERNPEVRSARFRFEAATKRPLQASTLPDPKIAYVDFGVGRPFSALDISNFAYRGVGVVQEVPFPGKLALAGQEAAREADSVREEARAVLLDAISRLKVAYYEWFYLTKAIDITNKNRDLLDRFERIARARYSVGKGIQQDVLKAQVELSTLAQHLEVLEQRRGSIEARINALLNRPPGTPLGRPAEVRRSTLDADLESVLQLVEENSPNLRRQDFLIAARSVGVERARKDYWPDFNFSFQYQRTASAFPDYYMTMAELKVPLYFWRKQRPALEEAKANLGAAREEQQGVRQELMFMAKDQYLIAKTSERLLALYESGIIPQAALSLESATSGYEVGSVDFLTLVNNFATLLTFEMQFYEELARHEQALARLEPLIARQLTR